MSVASHLDHLRDKHEALKEQIKDEERQPGTDTLAVGELKRKKLQLKDEIARLSGELVH